MAQVAISRDSVRKLWTIANEAEQDRERFRRVWEDIAAHANPSQADWEDNPPDNGETPNDTDHLFDNTLYKASNMLANGLQGYAFSSQGDWFRLALEGNAERNRARQAGIWLQDVERHLYRQLSRSNFYREGLSFVKALGDYGTAVMTRAEDMRFGGPVYKTRHLKRTLIFEDAFGVVDALFMSNWMTAYEAVDHFGIDALPKQIRDAFTQNKLTRFKIMQFIFPKDKFDLDFDGRGGKEYQSLFVAECDQDNPIESGGYEVKPFFVARWSRSLDGDVWGVDSPGQLEIGNAKQLNGMRKDFTRQVQLASRPPLKATEGLRGRMVLKPNGITYVRPGEDFVPAMTVARVESLAQDLQDYRRSVQESYYVDLFLTLTANLERQKTATEVGQIQGERAALFASFHGRLAGEFLEATIEDGFSMELRSGRIPPPPRELAGRELKIDMVSPLAQMQKRFLLMGQSANAWREIMAYAQIAPQILDNFDLDAHARSIAEAYHMDKTVVRDLIDVARMREAKARQQAAVMQQQMRNETMATEADAMQKLGKAPEQGSPAAAMMGGQA